MTTTARTDGWPYITLDVLGVPLQFKHLSMPGARRQLFADFIATQAEGAELSAAASAEGATAEDRAEMPRAHLLIEGAVGALLMRLYIGEPTPTHARVAEDLAAGKPIHFKGADHKEAAGLAFAEDLCERHGLAFETLSKCVRAIWEAQPPGSPEPGAADIKEVVRVFPAPKEATT